LKTNEKWLADRLLISRIHWRKLAGKPMARAKAGKFTVRAVVEHVFAHQKVRFGLFIRTIGLAYAESKLTVVNMGLIWPTISTG
jgi:hypothetical protein